ncbi:MAG: DNA polymerase III subunit alpha [bacterium]|nr:DNA polymerase III subunit alpha [bacterium]
MALISSSPKFTHLHVHSHYSLLDGLGKVDEIFEETKKQGMDSIALTDHGVLYGAVEWFQRATEFGVKPIIGLEGYISPNRMDQKRSRIDARPYHVTLIAKNQAGYRNLIKLVTIAHLQGYYYKPRFDYETLAAHSEGLICLSGCLIAHIPREILSGNIDQAAQLVKRYQSIFGKDNFYMEVQYHPTLDNQQVVNEAVIDLSKTFSAPLVATNDVHFVHKEDEPYHDILLCVQTGKKVQDKDRMSYTGLETWLKSPHEMAAAFPGMPEVLDNTQRIAEQCTFEVELGKVHLPKFKVPEDQTPATHLRSLCREGVQDRYGVSWDQAGTEIKERLTYELEIIEKTGFSSYFLIVQDFILWAKRNGIVVGPGRGSAAGSIVSYLLHITDVDPLHWELLFERFLNPARISPPDIDTDFDDARRGEVIEYVSNKYGRDHVAQIITFGTIKARAGIRDAGRVLGIPYAVCDKLAKMIPPTFDLTQALNELPDLKQIYRTDGQARQLLDSARKLEGVVRHASTHACGVVISDVPLAEICPTQFSTRGSDTAQNITTQYSLHPIEDMGMLKMDFLGLSNLTTIQHALDLIKKRHNTTIDIGNLPLDDKKTFELFRTARTTGVFQLESSGMKRYLKELQPTELEDIVAMVALYRPGPMEFIPTYIERKNQNIEPTYLHPKLKPILEKTYGVAIYQEQVMRIVRDLAGFSLGEADLLRKAVGKKIKSLLGEQRTKFIEGCLANGVGKEIAESVFAFIEPFAGYGFNRAHAVCYAMIAYQTAYLKANYPAEFMAALLRSDEDTIDRLSIEISECQQMNIKVLPPSVNQSMTHFTVVDLDPLTDAAGQQVPQYAIRFGLAAVKNLGSDAVEALRSEVKKAGPFTSLADLLSRINPRTVNKKSLEALVMSGALDEFAERQAMLSSSDALLQLARQAEAIRKSKQMSLFGGKDDKVQLTVTLEDTEPASRMQRLKWEKELLGLYVSEQPLTEHRTLIEQHANPIGSLTVRHVSQTVTIVGLVSHIHKITTRKGEPMMFVQLDDFSGNTEVVIFPSLLKDNPELYQEDVVLTVHGKVSDKDGTIKILADKTEPFDPTVLARQNPLLRPEDDPGPAPATVLPADRVELLLEQAFTTERLKNLKEKLEGLPTGDLAVFLRIQDGTRERRIQTTYKIDKRPEILAALEAIVGKGKVTS